MFSRIEVPDFLEKDKLERARFILTRFYMMRVLAKSDEDINAVYDEALRVLDSNSKG